VSTADRPTGFRAVAASGRLTDSAWRRPENRRPFVLGHRGARSRAPENTLAGFDLAMDEGADGVELDVRLCGSGQIVVCHDRTLERVSSGRDLRLVEQIALLELEQVDVGDGQRVPTLEAVLDWARERRARVNVEVKRDVRDLALLVRRVSELVQSVSDAPERILVSSFDVRAVRWLARELSGVAVGWLVHARQHLLNGAPGFSWLGARAVHPQNVLCTSESVARWKRRGALVNTWTVNDETRAAHLAGLGVDALISDDPGRILRALG
jgi:glycerophosphoryl diester phosphodiesterase